VVQGGFFAPHAPDDEIIILFTLSTAPLAPLRTGATGATVAPTLDCSTSIHFGVSRVKEQGLTGGAQGDQNSGTRAQRSERMRAIASKSRFGRIRIAVRRCFILTNGEPVLTRDVLERAYPRLRRFTSWHYLAARRALRMSAVVVARNRFGRGRPALWARHDAT
jgi:hypothetical protein